MNRFKNEMVSCDEKPDFSAAISVTMILQKSFSYADLVQDKIPGPKLICLTAVKPISNWRVQ